MFTSLRPVGNKIKYSNITYSDDLFEPYNTKFYQSGTAALASAMTAAKQANPEITQPKILLPAYACPDLISAVVYANVEPVLIDFEQDKPWMALDDIQKNLSDSVIAIIAVNLLGIPERVSLIKELLNNTHIVLIEDSAQSLPLDINSDYWQGDIVITSFGRGKPLGLLGGGAILTKEAELYKYLPSPKRTKLNLFKSLNYQLKLHLYNILTKHFIYHWLIKIPGLEIGKTSYKKLTALESCHTTILNLLTINYSVYKSKKLVNRKIQAMLQRINAPLIIDLPGVCNVDLAGPLLRYPILITDKKVRNQLLSCLNQHGLGASSMYADILPNIEGIDSNLFTEKNEYLSAKDFANHLITFPTHSDVKDSHIKKIESILLKLILDNA